MAVRSEVQRPAYPVPWYHGRFASWIATVDHKRIGILYIVSCLFFFAAGGVMALLIRTQLATPDMHVAERDSYSELFTMHGTTMVFLVVVPIFAGFANFMVPLMIGARDMAFPRLNALSFWLFLLGGIVLLGSFFAGGGAAKAGWTGYPPLSAQIAGNGQDLWIVGLHILSIASLAGAINFLATIHHMRTRRDDLDAAAALRLDDRDLLGAARRRAAGALGRADDAPARPPGLDALLPAGRGRQCAPLPARLLVLRPPRGLRDDPARRWGSSPR